MATLAIQPQPIHQQQHLHHTYPSHSILEDTSDDDSMSGDHEMSDEQFYQHQQQQARYYQQHQQQYGINEHQQQQQPQQQQVHIQNNGVHANDGQDGLEDDDMYSDDSSTASIPDENIDFSLTYALHTFLATVEGQASVVKGDSLLLLDDANSYWWLVRVLKTEDVGYIPAENIETPFERLARLNKHRNVDLAAATVQEKQAAEVKVREKLKGVIAGKAKGMRRDYSGEDLDIVAGRRVDFAPPTYVDHPGVTWSSDEEDGDEDGEGEGEEGEDEMDEESQEDHASQQTAMQGQARQVEGSAAGADGRPVYEMEPDDGMEWAEGAAQEQQKQSMEKRQQQNGPSPKSNNPFAPRTEAPASTSSSSLASSNGSTALDPAQAGNDTRRITATPAVAQGANGVLLPSAMTQQQSTGRNVSGQSIASTTSIVSSGSTSSINPSSPDEAKKARKMKKGSKEDLGDGEKKKRGMLGGLFSRGKKEKKGISSADARTSEDSIISGHTDGSPASQGRRSEDAYTQRAPTPADVKIATTSPQQGVPTHGLRLAQREQATHQAYMDKYLNKSTSGDLVSPSAAEAAAAVAQSAAAMRLAASMNASGKRGRPSSIILSPNPAGPPLLNVMRVFAGEHIKSEASFKTVLVNETTSSTDLIRQAMQRFHLHGASTPGADAGYYLTVKDVNGEEMELEPHEKPLAAFEEAVQRWTEEQDDVPRIGAITPTVKRSSISSISSVISLSSHPAIAKLGMNDFSDDSAVKIYVNRRRPGSTHINGMPDPNSEFSSYSTQLSTVQESSPETKNSDWSSTASGTPPSRSAASDATASPPTPQQRYNPSLTVTTTGQGSGSPERYHSPSARFTIQLLIHSGDLPDGSVFDPSSEAIIPKTILRDRQGDSTTSQSTEARRRLFVLPRNVTVLEAVEQGLERFGIQEGVVDGGDEIEDKIGKRRSMARVRYSLIASVDGEERTLAPSSKVLEAYSTAPNLRPIERSTLEQRRRSRDHSLNSGTPSDILPTDPIFVLRRVGHRSIQGRFGEMQRQQQQQFTSSTTEGTPQQPLSPQEIIAAQRAASRANQNAIISAHTNQTRGVDVVLPDRGTFRSSRLMEANGEVVRYSYIDGDGETYDISDLLAEEWGADAEAETEVVETLQPPQLQRMGTDQSAYVTAPSTPEVTERPPPVSKDILRGIAQQPEAKVEEKLQRVINKVKSNRPTVEDTPTASGRATPTVTVSGRSTPQPRFDSLSESRQVDVTPRASDREKEKEKEKEKERSESRQNHYQYQQTAATVNRIISRHRQQPSIASIMSDLSAVVGGGGGGDDAGTSTPLTATSSTHPTPPSSGAVFTRAISSASPTPRAPVVYHDDFGIKAMMAIINFRAAEMRPKSSRLKKVKEIDEVEKMFYGEKVDWEGEGIHPDIKGCFEGLQGKLDRLDGEIDELLAGLVGAAR